MNPSKQSDPDRDECFRRIVVRILPAQVAASPAPTSHRSVIFRRRPPQPQLIVSTSAMRRVASHMPAPQGPSLPMSEVAPRTGSAPQADVQAAVRESGAVISFLANGGSRAHLTTRVYDAITAAEGCGLGRSDSLLAFAEQFCDTDDGKRRLVQALAIHRPSTDPTALLTRLAIMAWVRTVGLAAQTRSALHTPASGLPDWHTPGDM